MPRNEKSPEVTVEMVKEAQKQWAQAIVAGDSKSVTDLYAKSGANWHREPPSKPDHSSLVSKKPDDCSLAFNPTLDDTFLTTEKETLLYFKGTDEKPGFARKGWTNVFFDPAEHRKVQRFIAPNSEGAIAVGRYVFEREDVVLDASGQEVLAVVRLAVDYTFVYKSFSGKLLIIAHHSSLPLSQKKVK